ncbi:serine hydrolase [Brachybacterium sp. NPDC056505]|uniref:serine hydrolase n=1 Tax=Brachybacterium sp. NPDC056505 TaxID=3345843 RepID=UPI00366D0A4C
MPTEDQEGATISDADAVPGAMELADDLGIDLSFCACALDGRGARISHLEDRLWPGASLYKLPAAIALCRSRGAALSAPVRVEPTQRVVGGAGISLMEDPVTLTWRELMRFMLVGSDNTSAAVILEDVGAAAVDAVTQDAGMTRSQVAGSADTVRRAVEEARRSAGFAQGTDLDDDLVDFAKDDAVLGSLTTAGDQVRLLTALWRGDLLESAGSALIKGMLGQQLAPIRISRILSYPGVLVAGKTGSWGPFRHDSAVVTHDGESPVAVSILTRSLEFDRLLPAVDDGIGEIAAMIVDGVRSSQV